MSLRVVLSLTGACALTLLGACAAQQSLKDLARAACEDQGVQPGPDMQECVQETEETLRRAREYDPGPPSGRGKQR